MMLHSNKVRRVGFHPFHLLTPDVLVRSPIKIYRFECDDFRCQIINESNGFGNVEKCIHSRGESVYH